MALGGRPKEQGGHKPLKISVEKFVAEALEKVGNKSQFLEKLAKPVLQQLDPGEASIFVWQINVFLSQKIIEATQQSNYAQVQALAWLADQLEDARKLCGVPELNNELLKQKDKPSKVEAIYNLYEKIINLYVHPTMRFYEDGTFTRYHNISEIIRILFILKEMHPSLKTAIPDNPANLTPEEFNQLIGKIGAVVYSLKK